MCNCTPPRCAVYCVPTADGVLEADPRLDPVSVTACIKVGVTTVTCLVTL